MIVDTGERFYILYIYKSQPHLYMVFSVNVYYETGLHSWSSGNLPRGCPLRLIATWSVRQL